MARGQWNTFARRIPVGYERWIAMRTWTTMLVLAGVITACGGARSSAELPSNRGGGESAPAPDEALERLRELAAALAADDATRALAVGDARDGIVFWGQPGAYPRPLFRVPPGSSGPLSEHAARAGADNYYTDPGGYWREVGATLEAALAVSRNDAGPYQLPPEEALESAAPWGSLDTRGVRLTEADYPALAEESEIAGIAAGQRQVLRFRAENKGSSVQVFMTRGGVSHVVLSWYDA
jgi:hypothetical protein